MGEAEAFSPAAASHLKGLGGVAVADMLPRLHPSIRQTAARRLRSFAAKPFALLACSFERALLMVRPVLSSEGC